VLCIADANAATNWATCRRDICVQAVLLVIAVTQYLAVRAAIHNGGRDD